MFIFDEPYISEVAEAFLITSQSPLLNNTFSENAISKKANLVPEKDAIRQLEQQDFRWVYTNSENAISWITETFGADSPWVRRIDLFKNKHKFREATADLFPDITFMQVSARKLHELTFDQVGGPFIIKPVVGFISAGVYRVNSPAEWDAVRKKVRRSTEAAARAFPEEVLNGNAYLVESVIPGEEYAVDAYFDDQNRPVVLNILHHRFKDEQDMSDRLYVTSPAMVNRLLPVMERFLNDISGLGDFRGLPLHAEVRIDAGGRVRPIEINPLRFAGWCSTDIAWYAYGINVYEYFSERKKPDWQAILKEKNNGAHAMAVIERPDSVPGHLGFDYEKLGRELSEVLSLRKIDHRRFPLYAFVFFRVGPETEHELDRLQALDPRRFVTERPLEQVA
jgi:hypothetical protein